MQLTKYEQETIILMNEDEKTASLYTCNRALQRKMDALCETFPEQYKHVKREPADEYGRFYELPKRYVRIGKPSNRKGDPNRFRKPQSDSSGK